MEITLSEFQDRCIKTLRGENGEASKSVLLVAPTGTGKTIAAVEPFAMPDDPTGGLLNTRLIYSLPMRALAGGIKAEADGRFKWHQQDWPMTIHHGQQAESDTFRERAIVTTIDQTLTAFCGAPLSFKAKSGHSAAGALCSSYAVFDEVHLLDPKAGLPLLFAMLRCRQDWGLRSCVMTATLPENVIRHFAEYLDLEIVRASEADAQYRDDRRKVTVRYAADVEPTPDARAVAVLEAYKEHGRVIVFCNTVPSALEMYQTLRPQVNEGDVILAHSRFAPEHRQARDKQVSDCLGEKGKGGILVTTQVAEVGLNISAPAVFSELAPADTLIQRTGRCARFFRAATPLTPERGSLTVWPLFTPGKVPNDKERTTGCLPYDSGVVMQTEQALAALCDGQPLDWKREQKFVNDSLTDFYSAFVGGQDLTKKDRDDLRKKQYAGRKPMPLTPVTALGAFERAFHAGDASMVESLLRDSLTVNVGIVNSFEEAENAYNQPGVGQRREYPETISVRLSTFAGLLKNDWQTREVKIEHSVRKKTDNADRADEKPMRLLPLERLRPNATYYLLAAEAGYTPEMGMPVKGKTAGQPTPIRRLPLYEKGQKQQEGKRQTWDEHALGAHREARRILAHYRPFIASWAASALPQTEMTADEMTESLLQILELAVLLHDVGKLNHHWQQAVGREPGEPPIARTTEEDRQRLREQKKPRPPFHAQYVFPLLKSLLCQEMQANYRLFDHIALAAARHHALTLDGDINKDKDDLFKWTPGGREMVIAVVQSVFGEDAPQSLTADFLDCLEKEQHAGEAPGPASSEYFLYCLTNRLVKFSDTCDAGAGSLELFLRGSGRANETGEATE